MWDIFHKLKTKKTTPKCHEFIVVLKAKYHSESIFLVSFISTLDIHSNIQRYIKTKFPERYCDFKSNIFNERLHSLGRRHSKILQFWFKIGIGFDISAMVRTIMIPIWDSSWLIA
jgi:hypothetical protein